MRFTRNIRYVIAVLATGFLSASCNPDNSPTAPRIPAMQNDLLGGTVDALGRIVGGLLTCRPQAFASDSKVIGPAGGTLHLGPHTLTIPAGALSQSVLISGQVVTDTVNSVRFSPEGLRFTRSAKLTLDYSNCNLIAGLLHPKHVAYTTDGLRILELLNSVDHPLQKNVTGDVNHFSRYAAAW